MPGGARKHGAHRYQLGPIAAAAGGTAADLLGDVLVYDAYAEAGIGTINGATIGYDQYQEAVIEAVITTYVTLTGQGTNFVTLELVHRNSAAVTQNSVGVAFSGSGVVATAFIPMNLGVASGAVVPGAGTGILVVTTGVALPWKLAPGDTITLDRLSNNGTGLATKAFSATITIAGYGA